MRKNLYFGMSTIAVVLSAAVAGPTAIANDPVTDNPPDCEPLEPVEIVTYDDGGKDYQYLIAGEITHAPVPPDGFRPESASDAMLDRYGFLPRPTSPEDLTAWTEDMLSYQYTPIPELCQVTEGSTADLRAPGAPDPEDPEPWTDEERATTVRETSANWAGFVANHPEGNHYVAVSGEYDQRGAGQDACPESRETAWVGLGGNSLRDNGTAGLLQVGTRVGPEGAKNAFWEYVGVNDQGEQVGVPQQILDNPNIRVGDHIHISLFFQRSNDQANFIIQNETTGASRSIIRDVPPVTYDGRTAEFIIERPSGGNPFYPLQNFDHIDWTHARILNENDDWKDLREMPKRIRIKMTHRVDANTVHVLARTGYLTGAGAFTSTFNRCI